MAFFRSRNLALRLAPAFSRGGSTQMQRLTHVVSPSSSFLLDSRLCESRLYCCSGKRNIMEVLKERMLVVEEEVTKDHVLRDNTTRLKVYCGFDPTAESLHIGNLLALIVLSWFKRCGHEVVVLVGGGTGLIGDPSGKIRERPELDKETLEKNVSAISGTISDILGRDMSSFQILNNNDWWKDLKIMEVLRNEGRLIRVNPMASRESVKKRCDSGQGMSFAEFSYPALQAYDFAHLFHHHQVNVQIGGTDQWGNIITGINLIRKKFPDEEGAYGLAIPLLLKPDGSKFGKSEEGAIWLSPSRLSPYHFYQFFFNVPDAEVIKFLLKFTFLRTEEISLIALQMKGGDYVPNMAQRRLAEEVTRFVHGEEGLNEALKATQALRPGSETKLDSASIETIAAGGPSFSLKLDQVLNVPILDLSFTIGLLASKNAARRLIRDGGLYLNNKKVDNEAKTIEAVDIVDGKVIVLSAGKKNKMIVRIS